MALFFLKDKVSFVETSAGVCLEDSRSCLDWPFEAKERLLNNFKAWAISNLMSSVLEFCWALGLFGNK